MNQVRKIGTKEHRTFSYLIGEIPGVTEIKLIRLSNDLMNLSPNPSDLLSYQS